MARPLRILIPDGWYHVFHRGTERRQIFADIRDRRHFLELLGKLRELYRFRIHAYALLDNHYHAIVQTPDANLSDGMQWLHLSHAAWFNTRHDRIGPFWQGRFRSVPVENSAWAYQLSLYVHLNPVRLDAFGLGKQGKRIEGLGLKVLSTGEITDRLKALRQFRWTSYRAYAGYEMGEDWLETEELGKRASRKKSERAGRYRKDVKNLLRKGGDESARERLVDAVAIGGEEFRRTVRRLADGGGRETTEKRELRRRVAFEEVVQAVERVKGQKREVFLNRHGDWGPPLVMRLARRYCGMTLREIGEAMGGKDYAAVSDRLRRFERSMKEDDALTRVERVAVGFLNLET